MTELAETARFLCVIREQLSVLALTKLDDRDRHGGLRLSDIRSIER